MSVSAITSNSSSSAQETLQLAQQEFQQIGQALQAGNLSAAQSDFVTLQSTVAKAGSSATQSSSPIQQEFSQLSDDLQSGNLSAAQQAYTQIQQTLLANATSSQQGTKVEGGHHHHHGGGDQSSELSQLMDQLGTALQAGNLSAAQQTYATMQSDLQQTTSGSSPSASTSLSVTA